MAVREVSEREHPKLGNSAGAKKKILFFKRKKRTNKLLVRGNVLWVPSSA